MEHKIFHSTVLMNFTRIPISLIILILSENITRSVGLPKLNGIDIYQNPPVFKQHRRIQHHQPQLLSTQLHHSFHQHHRHSLNRKSNHSVHGDVLNSPLNTQINHLPPQFVLHHHQFPHQNLQYQNTHKLLTQHVPTEIRKEPFISPKIPQLNFPSLSPNSQDPDSSSKLSNQIPVYFPQSTSYSEYNQVWLTKKLISFDFLFHRGKVKFYNQFSKIINRF